jgi:hypothetical protein
MRGHKSVILALILLGFLTALLVFCVIGHRVSPNVAVSFVGYTNSPSGARLAAFKITNQCSATIWHWADYYVEIRGKGGPARLPRHFGADTQLGPAQSVVYMVPAYTNQAGWRAMFYFSQSGQRLWLMQLVSRLPATVYHFLPEVLKSVRSWVVASDWIDN